MSKQSKTCHQQLKEISILHAIIQKIRNAHLIVIEINKHDYYQCKYCMENVSIDLREHVLKITNFKELKALPLTETEKKSYYKQKFGVYLKVNFLSKNTGKFEMIILLKNIGVLHVLYAI